MKRQKREFISLGKIDPDSPQYKGSIAEYADLFDKMMSERNLEKSRSLFRQRKVSQVIQEATTMPKQKPLFGDFWFEGEIAVLFARTNAGKSIKAVQIAESIQEGKSFGKGFPAPEKQNVVYFDFELSLRQFASRYMLDEGEIVNEEDLDFKGNFTRIEFNQDSDEFDMNTNFEEMLQASIEDMVTTTDARVVIIDNITYLATETEKARNATPLMQKLKVLKSKYGLSILILAHTPKRDDSKPITLNDLQGSSMIGNFADSVFTIGNSNQDSSVRYVKHLKARNTAKTYDGEKVLVLGLEKKTNFLKFEVLGDDSERAHLKEASAVRAELSKKAHELSAAGKTQREIATELNTSVATINRCLKEKK